MTENNQDKNQQEEVSLYEKIISRTEELLGDRRKSLDEALKRAGEEFTSAGHFTREQAEKVSSFIKRDIQHTVDNAEKGRETVKQAVAPKRVVVGAHSFFSKILSNTAETLSGWATKTEQHLEFKTGEVTSPGSLTCKNCGEVIHLKSTAKIPPCPKCHQSVYRKSY